MSYANGTQFYNLPQTVGTDKRDWFDTNSPFAAIDAALHSAVVGQASDAEAIATINGKLADDEADIAALQTKTTTHDSQIAALQTTVNSQTTQIQDVRQDAEDMITANNEGAAATSTRAYAIGDYFIYNDVLYKATAAIAIGDTIVPNTNCEATNVDTELTQVNSDLSNKQNKTDNSLNTTSKTVVGAINEINTNLTPSSVSISPLTGITFNGSRFYKSGRTINLNSLVRYSSNIASGQGFQTFANLSNNLPTSQVFFPASTYSGNIGTGTIKTDGTLQFDFPNGYTANDDIVMNVTYIN